MEKKKKGKRKNEIPVDTLELDQDLLSPSVQSPEESVESADSQVWLAAGWGNPACILVGEELGTRRRPCPLCLLAAPLSRDSPGRLMGTAGAAWPCRAPLPLALGPAELCRSCSVPKH